MKNPTKMNYEVTMNLGGGSIMTSRTDQKTAMRVAATFGLDQALDLGGSVIHWPITIRKIGKKTVLEQNALAQAVAPKLEIQGGEMLVVLMGKSPEGLSEEQKAQFFEFETALGLIRKHVEKENSERGEELLWGYATADPGTVLTRPGGE